MEGFLEAGPQLLLQTYIQFQTGWPTLQPLIGSVRSLKKGVYFPNQLPGKQCQPAFEVGSLQLCTESGTPMLNGTVDIFVIFQLTWLKFGLQAHNLKMFGHTKFQLSISCTFKWRYLDISTESNFEST